MHSDDDFETLAPADASPGKLKKSGLSLKARAIAFLSRREHSHVELQRKLAPHCDDPEEIEQLLKRLQDENWLSNERFAQSLVHRRAPRQGTSRIVHELKQHGLGDETIALLSDGLRNTEFQRAHEVWQKKFGHSPDNAKEYGRQYRFLASRGFSAECLRRILGDIPYGAD